MLGISETLGHRRNCISTCLCSDAFPPSMIVDGAGRVVVVAGTQAGSVVWIEPLIYGLSLHRASWLLVSSKFRHRNWRETAGDWRSRNDQPPQHKEP